MEEKIDLRIQRTYKLLTDALMEMLSEMDFEQITVRDLCERAMVRPATFYKHFADKYEFFTFVVRELMHQFRREKGLRFDPEHPRVFHMSMIDRTFSFMEENEEIVSNVIKGSSSHVLLDLVSEEINYEVLEVFRGVQQQGKDSPVHPESGEERAPSAAGKTGSSSAYGHPELMAVIFTGAIVNTLKWWVLQGFRPERTELLRELEDILASFYPSDSAEGTDTAV